MSGEQSSPLDDSDYGEIAEEIAEEMKEPDERLLSGEQPSLVDDSEYEKIAEEIAEERQREVEDSQEYIVIATKEPENMSYFDYREIAEEIDEEMQAEREAEAISEERKDEGRRPEVTKKVYSEETWAIALRISFTVSGLTLALYLLTSYAPLFWISAFFAAVWFVLLIIPRFIPRSSA